jgi:hypothetical protein
MERYRNAGSCNKFYIAANKLLQLHEQHKFDNETFIFMASEILDKYNQVSESIENGSIDSIDDIINNGEKFREHLQNLQSASMIQAAISFNHQLSESNDMKRIRSAWGILSAKNYPTMAIMKNILAQLKHTTSRS